METLTLIFWGTGHRILKTFIMECKEAYEKKTVVEPLLYHWEGDYWASQRYNPRSLDSIILPEKNSIVDDISEFKKSKDRYNYLGIPYHRNYLFYGLPGTGKTSLVSALARHFNAHVFLISLGDFTDERLKLAIHNVEPNSFVLIEDIDCTTRKRDVNKTEKDKRDISILKGVSLSGFLNVLDGIGISSGLVFFMTTNHKNDIDPALLRPGRADRKIYFGKADINQKQEMYKRFFPKSSNTEMQDFILAENVSTMAEFQELLLRKEKE